MSQEFWDSIKAIAIGMFDLAVGYLAGTVIDWPFSDKQKLLPIENVDAFWKVLGLVLAETAVTAAALTGLRALMYPREMDDPTGGMFFAQAIMMAEPSLWANLRGLADFMGGHLTRNSSPIEANTDQPGSNHSPGE